MSVEKCGPMAVPDAQSPGRQPRDDRPLPRRDHPTQRANGDAEKLGRFCEGPNTITAATAATAATGAALLPRESC